MHFLPLLSFLPLSLAIPHMKRQSATCGAREWQINQFTTFTAGSTPSPIAPPAFSDDFISFYFEDPNFDVSALCQRSVEPGTGQLADDNLYPCAGNNMFFSYAGGSVTLQRTGVKCDNATYKETGSTGLALNCFPNFGGTECETPTGQISVPVSFLEETGP